MRKYLTVLAATLAASLWLAVGATVASATPAPTQTADASVCGEVTLAGTPGQYDGTYTLSWRVEGDTANNGAFDLPGTDTVTFDEDYLGGEISVIYSVTGPESDENLDPEEVTVDTDCADEVPETTTTVPETPSTTVPGDVLDCDDIDPNTPVEPGDPNNLDGDNDGIACEQTVAAPVAQPATAVVATPSFTG